MEKSKEEIDAFWNGVFIGVAIAITAMVIGVVAAAVHA